MHIDRFLPSLCGPGDPEVQKSEAAGFVFLSNLTVKGSASQMSGTQIYKTPPSPGFGCGNPLNKTTTHHNNVGHVPLHTGGCFWTPGAISESK